MRALYSMLLAFVILLVLRTGHWWGGDEDLEINLVAIARGFFFVFILYVPISRLSSYLHMKCIHRLLLICLWHEQKNREAKKKNR